MRKYEKAIKEEEIQTDNKYMQIEDKNPPSWHSGAFTANEEVVEERSQLFVGTCIWASRVGDLGKHRSDTCQLPAGVDPGEGQFRAGVGVEKGECCRAHLHL